MTPNDMPPSRWQRSMPTDRHREKRAQLLPPCPFIRARSRTTKVGKVPATATTTVTNTAIAFTLR